MTRHVWAGLWLAASLAAAGAAQPGYLVQVKDVPRAAVGNGQLRIKVVYTSPDGATTTLRGELKDQRGEVIQKRPTTITGSGETVIVFDLPSIAETANVQVAVWMGEDWRESLCDIVHTAVIPLVSPARAAELAARRQRVASQVAALTSAPRGAGRVGLYAATPGAGQTLAAKLAARGYRVQSLSADMVGSPDIVSPDVLDYLILCDPRRMPGDSADAVADYARAGGRLIVLGGPAFETLLYPLGDRWVERDALHTELAGHITSRPAMTFDSGDFSGWELSSNDAKSTERLDRVTPGAKGSAACVKLTINNLTGWNTVRAPRFESPFTDGASWTVFWAKGDADTSQMELEWQERDGSRWIAVVPLHTTWQPYALPPSAFKYWSDGQGRGGQGDGFKPSNAVGFSFGLADTHTNQVGHGRHTMWLDELGVAGAEGDNAARLQQISEESDAPYIDEVSPRYKFFPVTCAASRVDDPDALLSGARLPQLPAKLTSPHPRPDGGGIDKGRRARYIPLIQCRDAKNCGCGDPVALLLNGENGRGCTLTAPSGDAAYWNTNAAADWLVRVVDRLSAGLFLYEAGCSVNATWGGETLPVGALVSNRGAQSSPATVKVRITAAGQTVYERSWPVDPAAGATQSVRDEWHIPADARGAFEVETTLSTDRVIDRLRHEVRVITPSAQPDYITARNGDWYLDGHRWFAMGVNYMPSSGIATEDGTYFERWLSARSYDQAVVDRDLRRLKDVGLNCVSVFLYYDDLAARNLLDLLSRCRELGLKVNLSLRPGTPLDFPWAQVKEMIQTLRLAESDTVFAYDLAWEPNWGTPADTAVWDKDWLAWVDRRYGSLSAAEQAWGVSLPREKGQPARPTNQQLVENGAHRALVLDYRAFLNDLLIEKYGGARTLVRTVDPHHGVSFRMSGAGDPLWAPPYMTYDFAGLGKAVDLFAPEGYGRIGNWDRVKVGWWTIAYARAANPDLPAWWAEFGTTTWNAALNAPDPSRVASQVKFYDDFLKMVQLSGSNGACCWWYPGGYRTGEKSDFGIVNPDGSWRPVTKVLNRWAPTLKAAPARKTPTRWIDLDPNSTVRGISGLYEQSQKEFWAAVAAGETPGLRIKTSKR